MYPVLTAREVSSTIGCSVVHGVSPVAPADWPPGRGMIRQSWFMALATQVAMSSTVGQSGSAVPGPGLPSSQVLNAAGASRHASGGVLLEAPPLPVGLLRPRLGR